MDAAELLRALDDEHTRGRAALTAATTLEELDAAQVTVLGRKSAFGQLQRELGTLPDGVHLESWLPQAEVMPHAAAMICHGGAGTVRIGLAGGVPMAVLPLFADQPLNAAAVARSGAGLALDGPGQIAAAVEELLRDPAYRATAGRIGGEIAALPLAGEALDRVFTSV